MDLRRVTTIILGIVILVTTFSAIVDASEEKYPTHPIEVAGEQRFDPDLYGKRRHDQVSDCHSGSRKTTGGHQQKARHGRSEWIRYLLDKEFHPDSQVPPSPVPYPRLQKETIGFSG